MKVIDFIKKYFSKIDRNILTYSICVLIAGGLWALNSLNKEYTTDISYPVRYTDMPQDMYLVNDPPEKITLEVKASGFVLLRHQISHSFLPVTFSLTKFSERTDKDISEYTITLTDIREKINNQINSSVTLINIKPHEIHFRFSPAVSKTVKIEPVVEYKLKRGYILKDSIGCSPQYITISGPAAIIDTIQKIYTKRWDAGEIYKAKSTEIDLLAENKVNLEQNSVSLSIEGEKYTQAKKEIPINIINLPDSLTIKLFPGFVDVTYEVGLSRYDRIHEKDFSFEVEYSPDFSSSLLPVKTDKIPPFIQNLKYTPQHVEFILEKK